MAQATLRFGSLTLCSPSNGLDGYEQTGHSFTKMDALEVSIPGTSGRIKMVVGRGLSEQTTFKMAFDCQKNFSSTANLHAFLESVETKLSGSTRTLDTVYYGILDNATTYNETNCEMEFELVEVWKSFDGYWLDFKVQFSKWGT